MDDEVKARRPYDSTRRREQAAATRNRILAAARELFLARGYAATPVALIAAQAGVNLDTLYASVGTKVVLLRTLVERAISGGDQAVVAEERDYVRAITAEPDPARKLELYAAAIRSIHERLVPLFLVMRDAASVDPDIAALWREIAERRAANMGRLAQGLAGTGALRDDLTVAEVAGVIWATNSAEFYDLLVGQRGWTPQRFEAWLADAWIRLLLDPTWTDGDGHRAGGTGRS